jgi:uncharacterized protein YndB with AHSA1/START domain
MVIKETITISSTLEKVWDTFTDLACWVNWNTVLKDVRTKGRSLTDGKSLKCTLRPFFLPINVKIQIEEIVPQERIVWIARKKGLEARHEFLFESNQEGTHVISRETFTGMLTVGSGLLLPVKRMKSLTKIFLKDLKKAAEQ